MDTVKTQTTSLSFVFTQMPAAISDMKRGIIPYVIGEFPTRHLTKEVVVTGGYLGTKQKIISQILGNLLKI